MVVLRRGVRVVLLCLLLRESSLLLRLLLLFRAVCDCCCEARCACCCWLAVYLDGLKNARGVRKTLPVTLGLLLDAEAGG